MTQFLILLEGVKTLARIPIVKWSVLGLGFYILIGHRFCDRTERTTEYEKATYTPKYGQLSDDLLDSVLMNLVRQNPDITTDIALSYVNDTTLMQIDQHIEKSRKYIVNFKITRGGTIVPIEQ